MCQAGIKFSQRSLEHAAVNVILSRRNLLQNALARKQQAFALTLRSTLCGSESSLRAYAINRSLCLLFLNRLALPSTRHDQSIGADLLKFMYRVRGDCEQTQYSNSKAYSGFTSNSAPFCSDFRKSDKSHIFRVIAASFRQDHTSINPNSHRSLTAMKRKMLLVLAAAIMLLGTLSTPTIVRADGTPDPNCPTAKMCKP